MLKSLRIRRRDEQFGAVCEFLVSQLSIPLASTATQCRKGARPSERGNPELQEGEEYLVCGASLLPSVDLGRCLSCWVHNNPSICPLIGLAVVVLVRDAFMKATTAFARHLSFSFQDEAGGLGEMPPTNGESPKIAKIAQAPSVAQIAREAIMPM